MKKEIIKEIENIGSSLEEIGKALKNISKYLSNSENKFEEKALDKKKDVEKMEKEQNVEILERDYYKIKDEIINFLENNNFSIVNVPSEGKPTSLDTISKFIGDKHEYIKDFLKKLKKSLNTGNPIRIYMKDYPEEKITYICQLASNLYSIAFLKEYKYSKSPKYILYADPLREPLVINFINGKWLEDYLVLKIKENLDKEGFVEGVDYDYLQNIKIKLPNGNNFELDVLFKINDEIFWFEAKTGDYQQYVHKYSKISNLLGIPQNRAFMLITEITSAGAEAVTSLFNMTVCNLDTWEEKFINSLKEINIFKEQS